MARGPRLLPEIDGRHRPTDFDEEPPMSAPRREDIPSPDLAAILAVFQPIGRFIRDARIDRSARELLGDEDLRRLGAMVGMDLRRESIAGLGG